MGQNIEPQKSDLTQAIEDLRRDARPGDIGACLSAASVLVEHAAYELARGPSSTHVSSLILVSAQLDRIAKALPSEPAEQA